MDLQKIERLIRKYENGETSLEEELELKIFFAKENVPGHLSGYKDLFSFYRKAVEEEIPDPAFDDRVLDLILEGSGQVKEKGLVRRLYPIWSMAAAILLLAGIYFFLRNQSRTVDTFDDPVIAYAETKRILMKVSDNLNTGVEELSNVKEMQSGLDDLGNIKTFNEGMKNMKRISVLDKSKDIITQKTNKQ